jgi:hypothetical protein
MRFPCFKAYFLEVTSHWIGVHFIKYDIQGYSREGYF